MIREKDYYSNYVFHDFGYQYNIYFVNRLVGISIMLNPTKNLILYPLNYPIEQNDKYWYFESPCVNVNSVKHLELIQRYHVYAETVLPITTNETIRMNLKIHKKLGRDNKFVTQYTIQYHDNINNTIIRADNDHPYQHIDLKLHNNNQEKRVFDTDPSDYEAAINTVLRYAEIYNNCFIGVDYWLFNIASFNKELLHVFFSSSKGSLGTQTSFTDIARLVSVDILTAEGEVSYDFNRLARVITPKFIECMQFEGKHKRPIKISKNLIQAGEKTDLLPFPIITDSVTPVINKVLDNSGNELPGHKVNFRGKTSFRK
jgi:hypothetical protein